MPKVIFYREGIVKDSGLRRGLLVDVMSSYRSIQASWTHVTVDLDGERKLHLRTGVPFSVNLERGQHRVTASGAGFVDAVCTLDVGRSHGQIVAVSPYWREGVTKEHPLGTLWLRPNADPTTLQPYAFYQEMGVGSGSGFARPLLTSLVASTVFLGLGILPVVAVAYLAVAAPVDLLVMIPAMLVLAPICIPGGGGGLLTTWRFLRLPASLRSPPDRAGSDGATADSV